ncbi:hypothetical protein COS52_03505 [Candidatus Roizmanbacteria bacterium CG03_land_8_20_14_0_80_39_12]|uniref:Uncharacterized protein n=1 Tax=Candidatus Roizmanbacteria bacterium CG03_land_8_20_14_0_80_39_12 TaxID=1974847 RepID=A0A2M7BS37_9BACT|nr:MAG: hypothetical protein COS52_03505 [Candidatus Roizmanbacteria bacterium CG03_land_8_20_14_0_80_39_12]
MFALQIKKYTDDYDSGKEEWRIDSHCPKKPSAQYRPHDAPQASCRLQESEGFPIFMQVD